MIDMYCQTRAEGFGQEVKRRIMLGTYALSSGYYDAYYLKAAKVRTLITRDFKKAFESCDAIFCPTAPSPPFKIGEKIDDPIQMYLTDVFTIPVNMAGLPGIALPGGFSRAGPASGIPIDRAPFPGGSPGSVNRGFPERNRSSPETTPL